MNLSNNEIIDLESGAKLEITLAPFLEGERLFSAVADCLKKVNIDGNKEVEDYMNINNLKDAFLTCISSKELKDAIIQCAKRCTYNGQRITSWDFFEDVNVRQDYLPVCWEICKFNLLPFTRNLFAKLNSITGMTKIIQK